MFAEGPLVVGYQVTADTANNVTREYRQAWYCVPVAGPQPIRESPQPSPFLRGVFPEKHGVLGFGRFLRVAAAHQRGEGTLGSNAGTDGPGGRLPTFWATLFRATKQTQLLPEATGRLAHSLGQAKCLRPQREVDRLGEFLQVDIEFAASGAHSSSLL